MKIAVLGTRGIPAQHGGVERHCEELYTRLAAQGHQVTVFTRAGYVDHASDRYKGVRLKAMPTVYTKHLEAITHTLGGGIASLLGDYEIIHFHALGPTSLSWLPRLKPGVKVFSTCHGLDWQRSKWGGPASYYLRFGEFASRVFPHRLICVAQYLADYFGKRCRTAVYIPNGVVMPNELLAKPPFDLKIKGYLLFVGRLVPEKGVHHLISAFKRVKTDKRLVIVGDSSGCDEYVRRIRESAKEDPRIIFAGYVYGEALALLYSNALAFALPSDLEGLPIALLEALSYGIPTIASDIEANKEVMGHDDSFGYLFDTGDAEALREAIEKAIGDPHLGAKGAAATVFVSKYYNWDDVALETEAQYLASLNGEDRASHFADPRSLDRVSENQPADRGFAI
ncbi:MAG: glycosyltransferase family 4 protein [Candidatus Aquicultorales bacterium]